MARQQHDGLGRSIRELELLREFVTESYTAPGGEKLPGDQVEHFVAHLHRRLESARAATRRADRAARATRSRH